MTPDETNAENAKSEAQVADEPAQPRRRAGTVRQVHNVAGIPDIFVEGAPAREVRRGKRPEVDLSDYRGHDRISVANLEDDPADA